MPRSIDWTPEEDAYLALWYPGMGVDLCAAALDRPVGSVYARAHKLGIKYAGRPGEQLRASRITWSPALDQILLTSYTAMGGKWCADAIGRSPGAIRMRALKLRKLKAAGK